MYFFLILSTQLVFCQNVSLLYGGIPSGRQNCIFLIRFTLLSFGKSFVSAFPPGDLLYVSPCHRLKW